MKPFCEETEKVGSERVIPKAVGSSKDCKVLTLTNHHFRASCIRNSKEVRMKIRETFDNTYSLSVFN